MNELIKKESNYHTTQELMSMAKVFAESGMFADTRQAAQAFVKIQAGAEMGIPPFAAMSGIHIIKGRPSIGAGIMASRIKSSGKYDYKIVQQDDKACVIDFYRGKDHLGRSSFTFDDARKAGTQNLDKFARNMLFARAISNGVKWFCPDVFSCSVYTPEELQQENTDWSSVVAEEPKAAIEQPKQPKLELPPAPSLNENIEAMPHEVCEYFPPFSDLKGKKITELDQEELELVMYGINELQARSRDSNNKKWFGRIFITAQLENERRKKTSPVENQETAQ